MNFFTKVILGTVAVLLLAVGVVIAFRSREAGKVEAVVREAGEWVLQGDAERVAALVDEDYDRAEEARSEIRSRIRPGAFEILEIVSLEVGVQGDEANANLVLRWKRPDFPYTIPNDRVRVRLRKRGEEWKVTGYDHEGPQGLR